MSLKIHLVIIDPQNDFMGNDDGSPYSITTTDGVTISASLPVQGAVSDMKRLAKMINRVGGRIEDFHLTFDSHRVIDVGHPFFWRNKAGESPPPLITTLVPSDIDNEIWYPRREKIVDSSGNVVSSRVKMRAFLQALVDGGTYQGQTIWPEHCLIGSWGHNIQIDLAAALQRWERNFFGNVDYIVKGTNYLTEHFGALQAEVPDAADPTTILNSKFIEIMRDADIIGIAGEASSHCCLATIKQIAEHIGDEHLKKFYLLTDAMSPVGYYPPGPNFPEIAKQFFADMAAQKGMNLTTTDAFLA